MASKLCPKICFLLMFGNCDMTHQEPVCFPSRLVKFRIRCATCEKDLICIKSLGCLQIRVMKFYQNINKADFCKKVLFTSLFFMMLFGLSTEPQHPCQLPQDFGLSNVPSLICHRPLTMLCPQSLDLLRH